MRSSTNASLYNIAHCNLFVIRALVALFKREPNTRDRAIIESAARNFSTRHCSLRPIPPHHQIAHACSIACLSHFNEIWRYHRNALEVLRDKKQI